MYARFNPSKSRIREGRICCATPDIASGRLEGVSISVHSPNMHIFLSWILQMHNENILGNKNAEDDSVVAWSRESVINAFRLPKNCAFYACEKCTLVLSCGKH